MKSCLWDGEQIPVVDLQENRLQTETSTGKGDKNIQGNGEDWEDWDRLASFVLSGVLGLILKNI